MYKIALITTIEGITNKNNTNGTFDVIRDYEAEAIKCFKYWRKNAGWLKDIPIYTHCPTENKITEKTINELKKLNVTYFDNFIPKTKTYTNGFINVFISGEFRDK